MQNAHDEHVVAFRPIIDSVLALPPATKSRANAVTLTPKSWIARELLTAPFELTKVQGTLLVAPSSARVLSDREQVLLSAQGQAKAAHRLSLRDAQMSPHPSERVSLRNATGVALVDGGA